MIEADALAEGFQAFVRRNLKNTTARRCSGQSNTPVRYRWNKSLFAAKSRANRIIAA